MKGKKNPSSDEGQEESLSGDRNGESHYQMSEPAPKKKEKKEDDCLYENDDSGIQWMKRQMMKMQMMKTTKTE
jgi:hypothetical protein